MRRRFRWRRSERKRSWLVVALLAVLLLVTCLSLTRNSNPALGALDIQDESLEHERVLNSEHKQLRDGSDKLQQDARSSFDLSTDYGSIRAYESREDLVTTATKLLSVYQAAEDSTLASYGYIDLSGNVWACVVQGEGWVDICLVSENLNQQSEVRTIRLDEKQWEESYGDQLIEELLSAQGPQ